MNKYENIIYFLNSYVFFFLKCLVRSQYKIALRKINVSILI